MSYRILEVNGKIYEYVIGRRFVKIRGQRNVIPKSECGIKINDGIYYDGPARFMVSPGTLRDYLANGSFQQPVYYCSKHNLPKSFRCDPFDAEITGKINYHWFCDKCYEERSWDI